MSFSPGRAGIASRHYYTLINENGAAVLGEADLDLRVVREDGLWYDFSDGLFKIGASVVTLDQALVDLDTVRAPGLYYVSWTPPAAGIYVLIVMLDGVLVAASELQVDQLATAAGVATRAAPGDPMTLTSGERTAVEAAVWLTAEGAPPIDSRGYALWLLREALEGRTEASAEGDGGHEILYRASGAELLRWPLRGGAGEPITTPTGSPARRGRAVRGPGATP